MKKYLAVDIGASSGRHILGWLEDGKLKLSEVYRFKNGIQPRGGHFCWDADGLRESVVRGLAKCAQVGSKPESAAIDTWGVDFVLLDQELNRIGDAVAYRDSRTQGIPEAFEETLSFEVLYERTGIQKQSFNTIYQLLALKKEAPEQLEQAAHFLMMPDYLNFCLTGVCANEYTQASTTALVGAREKAWDTALMEQVGIPTSIFHPLRMAGEALGGLTPAVRAQTGFDTTVRLAPSHDTASAFLAVPARDENAVFLSSGTWSLFGVELTEPITTPESREQNFTNEGGYQYRYRYLRNIMGLWMIQSLRRELGEEQYSFGALTQLAQSAAEYAGRVDVNDQRFLAPDSMAGAVRTVLSENGFENPTLEELLSCVYHSLADCYADSVRALEKITGKTYTSLNIVGGGSQDAYLNQLTADATGLTVYAGPTEGTAIGNLAVQMIADGALRDVQHARDVIRESFPIRVFEPKRKDETEC